VGVQGGRQVPKTPTPAGFALWTAPQAGTHLTVTSVMAVTGPPERHPGAGRTSAAWESTPSSKPNVDTTPRRLSRSKGHSKPTAHATGMGKTGCASQSVHETQALDAGTARYPHRRTYEERRRVTLDRVHATPSAQCGSKGKPAQPGSPWRKGHQHADGLRIVGKAILRDLWLAWGND
jgi:hypothetical protein